MTERAFKISRFLAPLAALLMVGCQQGFDIEIVGHETFVYDGDYSFPSELSYLEPEYGEQVVRFDVLSGDDLSALEERLDLNGYNVSIQECSLMEGGGTRNSYSGLAVLAKPLQGTPEEWSFFITKRFMQQAQIELSRLAQAPETENYCFQLFGGSMTGASAMSQEVQISDSALKDLVDLIGQ